MMEPIPLHAITIEGSEGGQHLLVTGGVHGDEFTPIAAVRVLSRSIEHSELNGRITLVPVVNEAAFLRGQRMAEDDLDLARVCPGRKDGSVTTRTAYALSELIRSADYYIDLHTGSATTAIHPMVGYTLHQRESILNKQREMARAFNLPIVWGTTATLDGRSLSVARDANVPAIYAEYMGSGVCDPDGVQAYVTGCLNVMAVLGMIDRSLPPSQIQHFVEDDGPNSGHMQIQNPSPATGFFEPSVQLGDSIRTGDRIGTVFDVGDDGAVEITSKQNGIVLGLQTFSRVLKGESVSVILETRGVEGTSQSERSHC
jgi:predicted deacylase